MARTDLMLWRADGYDDTMPCSTSGPSGSAAFPRRRSTRWTRRTRLRCEQFRGGRNVTPQSALL